MEWFPIIVFLVLLALNLQVAFAIAIASLSFFMMSSGVPQELFIQRFVAVTHSFPLLAVPFFILAGVIMNASGITNRLMLLADAFVGHMVGGLAQVNIMLSTLMGGMSGSANADAAMQSKILVPEMTKRGYEAPFSAAVTACSSIISVIIPPGIGLILYGFLGNVSIGRLFAAGFLPGFVLCVGLMLVAGRISTLRGYRPMRDQRASWPERGSAFVHAFWALLMPIGIIGGIRFGFFTPTEAGAAAVIYATIVGIAYRELKLRESAKILLEAAMATAVVMLVIAAAASLGYYFAWHQIPDKISKGLLAITENPILLLLVINLLLLVLGAFIEGGGRADHPDADPCSGDQCGWHRPSPFRDRHGP
ncbi:TRAP transporter large permease [Sedimentitalea nanhaiensis]|uniref:TRAP transporter large permease protein n=1 Tax=Sedimentitalea nanhaiensis TaxID=999627 RepID=A0A1I7E306_9RHOB|nr:TRAP transporter large permease [Sedimentitalea nanhaiensis]SFU18308.1 TRAP transporter, DctM subunit [Sedimentitalea nanhaiensis]